MGKTLETPHDITNYITELELKIWRAPASYFQNNNINSTNLAKDEHIISLSEMLLMIYLSEMFKYGENFPQQQPLLSDTCGHWCQNASWLKC